jgi:hypothetical protein
MHLGLYPLLDGDRCWWLGAMLETCGSAGKGKRRGCTFPVIES